MNRRGKLKPCPFCGSEDVTLWPMVASEGKWHSPLCEDCGATIEENVTGSAAGTTRHTDQCNQLVAALDAAEKAVPQEK